jgi:hypothetical protein
MNYKQRQVLGWTIAIFLGSAAFPPWLQTSTEIRGFGQYAQRITDQTVHYAFLFDPPSNSGVAIGILVVQWVVLAVVSGGLLLLAATPRAGDGRERRAQTRRLPTAEENIHPSRGPVITEVASAPEPLLGASSASSNADVKRTHWSRLFLCLLSVMAIPLLGVVVSWVQKPDLDVHCASQPASSVNQQQPAPTSIADPSALVTDEQYAAAFIREHSTWLYERDARGNYLQDAATGRSILTQAGQRFRDHLHAAERIGIRGQQDQVNYALNKLRADLSGLGERPVR